MPCPGSNVELVMVAWVTGEPAKGVSARELASPLICHVVPWVREGYPSHSPALLSLATCGRWEGGATVQLVRVGCAPRTGSTIELALVVWAQVSCPEDTRVGELTLPLASCGTG